ncbi:MAG: TatD family nuclease-associated radical SAM protein [Syntrophomonadaceae bacterium]|nr:TatD family nuclease-associated radical SAM protein [Syntrophomonadaceae bacterium]
MIITYEVRDSLYLNITNRCTNNCTFCIRNKLDGVGTGNNLWLDREPTAAEIVTDIQKRDLVGYKELVFCGFGEPTLRLPDIIEVCKLVKGRYEIPIRINTNGQGSLAAGRDITPQLEHWVDAVYISMNAGNKKDYQTLCQSVFGEAAYEAVLDFACRCKRHVPVVVFTVVDFLSGAAIQECEATVREMGVGFKIRHFVNPT